MPLREAKTHRRFVDHAAPMKPLLPFFDVR